MNRDTEQSTFSLDGGFPYNGIESRKQLPNRITLELVDQKVACTHMGDFEIPEETETLDFTIERAFDFQEALKTAEIQIEAMLTDDPFIPEHLGFELAYKPDTIYDRPIRMYASKYDERYMLHREIVDVHAKEIDSSMWVLMKKVSNERFENISLRLPSERVAFTVFYAMGIQMKEEQVSGSEAPVIEEGGDNASV